MSVPEIHTGNTSTDVFSLFDSVYYVVWDAALNAFWSIWKRKNQKILHPSIGFQCIIVFQMKKKRKKKPYTIQNMLSLGQMCIYSLYLSPTDCNNCTSFFRLSFFYSRDNLASCLLISLSLSVGVTVTSKVRGESAFHSPSLW